MQAGAVLLLTVLLLTALLLAAAAGADISENPTLKIDHGRVETRYEGPLYHFQPDINLKFFSARVTLQRNEEQCLYVVLLKDHRLHVSVNTIRFVTDDIFDVAVSDGQGASIGGALSVPRLQQQLVVTATDTYEVCMLNRGNQKKLGFTITYFQPPELLNSTREAFQVHNFSSTAARSVQIAELRVGEALAQLRTKSEAYRDEQQLGSTNFRIQLRAVATLTLQLLSAALTTFFIRQLFATAPTDATRVHA